MKLSPVQERIVNFLKNPGWTLSAFVTMFPGHTRIVVKNDKWEWVEKITLPTYHALRDKHKVLKLVERRGAFETIWTLT